jgi:hypothetical protein
MVAPNGEARPCLVAHDESKIGGAAATHGSELVEHAVCLFDASGRKRVQEFFEDSLAFEERSG